MVSIFDLIHDPKSKQALQTLTEERRVWLDWKPFIEIKEKIAALPQVAAEHFKFNDAKVVIGEERAPDDPLYEQINEACKAILPWKKGPFQLFGVDIDAEWRSDYKWDRLRDKLPSLAGQQILDVGGNNGYYAFRMLADAPSYVLNIDPVPRLWYQFNLLQHFARRPELEFFMWGWQETANFKHLFDTVFCMGIIYHHHDPVQILKYLYQALRPGGLLVLESIVIPGEEDLCLFPADRYAKMRNVWFVPTVSAMRNMLLRTKFTDIETVAVNRHESEEQRTTDWNPGQSHADFMDPDHPDRTIEGYPAPHRAILIARKPKR